MGTSDQEILQLRGPILIVGASGFVGANLFKKVFALRKDVIAVVQEAKSWRLDDAPSDQVSAADLRDPVAVRGLIDAVNPQTIFDCIAYGAYSFEEDVERIYLTNFQALVNLVNALSGRPFSAYIHAGSSSEYGRNSKAPLEDAKCLPNSHYSVSKIASGTFLEYMGKERGFPCAHLRLYSVFGPYEDTSRLIPNLLKQTLLGKLPPLVSPTISRDFVYVDDVCDAFVLAATRMSPLISGEAFNIGTGKKTAISDLVELVSSAFKISEMPVYGSMNARTWDLDDWYANPGKAERMLGWKAQTPLLDGMRLTRDWVSKLSDEQYQAATKRNIRRQRYSVSAIIACYKDAQAIPHMHRRLTEVFRQLDVEYEIIFVNDCSPDNTIDIIEAISVTDPRVIGISHSRNFGSQMAFRSGMEVFTKSSVVLLDGDLQDPPELIKGFHSKWCDGFDVVYGRRVKREMAWYWGLLYKAFYRVFAAFSYINIPHDAGDFSLMNRRVVDWLLQCGERDLFLRGLRAYVGFKQTGVDYIRPERMFGVSTNSFIRNLDWAKRGIFSFSNTPLAILTSLGVATFGISLALALVAFVAKLFFPAVAPQGLTTLLILTLVFGSLNLLAIGVVGEYIGKIMLEVKARPRLIRSEIIRSGKSTNLQFGSLIKK